MSGSGETRYCSYCGVRNPAEARYCRACGREVAGGIRLDAGPEPPVLGACRNCGAPLYEGDRRCPTCRAPVRGMLRRPVEPAGQAPGRGLGAALRRLRWW